METFVAENSGFCPGVQHAYNTAVSQDCGAKVLGQLVHNPEVSAKLHNKGIIEVDSMKEIDDWETVIIRAHGALASQLEEMRRRSMHVVDCTCKKVKRIQRLASQNSRAGNRVAVFGKQGHPEFESICSFVEGEAIKISKPSDIEGLGNETASLVLLAQTTSSPERYKLIKDLLQAKIRDLHTPNTLCAFTRDALTAAQQLATQVEAMLVIGGKNSSNTKNLFEVCSKETLAFHIENERALDIIHLEDVSSIGITAGASTPPETIEKVVQRLNGSLK